MLCPLVPLTDGVIPLQITGCKIFPADTISNRGTLMHKYEIIIYWSNEDGAFVAEVPELPGCAAHGDTQEAALENISQAMDLWIETAREFGDPIPEPKGERLMLA